MGNERSDSMKVGRSAAAAHLGIIIGTYTAGAAVLALAMLNAPPSPGPLTIIFLATVSVYLLDRAGWRAGCQDPADSICDPDRAAFMQRHGGWVRIMAWLTLGTAVAMAAWRAWWLLAFVAAAPVTLAAYLCGDLGHRIKDRLFIKNIVVGSAIAGFVVVISVTHLAATPSVVAIGVVGVVMFLQVVADCIICDIDDIAGDRASGTQTIANTWSPVVAWTIAGALILTSATVVAAGIAMAVLPVLPPIIASSTMTAMWVILLIWRPARVRNVVDGRLGLSGAVTWIVLGLG